MALQCDKLRQALLIMHGAQVNEPECELLHCHTSLSTGLLLACRPQGPCKMAENGTSSMVGSSHLAGGLLDLA